MRINYELHVYCSHCGKEMPIYMERKVGVKVVPGDQHWIVCPCLCQYRNKELVKQQGHLTNDLGPITGEL